MRKLSNFINYFFTGVGFGAATYLIILTFASPSIPTRLGVISVFIISGLIGILSMIFAMDVPTAIAFSVHIIGTFLLVLLMCWINKWPINFWLVGVFVLVYIVIWLIVILSQVHTVNKINSRIKKRNSKK
ncbi:DUF3021 domain-containing protein [Lactobacillus kimbladii]|uniref:DUF3021 family protein n=1 Tax=Lactobacillus kimbladii TaxID=1218506 RepID=UPI00164F065B|nr:DUF3021 family protein [Lactobacillus kimbladii]MBC6341587.1 DUF3021 domain-containing protein [Lactobacillus kimbladii]